MYLNNTCIWIYLTKQREVLDKKATSGKNYLVPPPCTSKDTNKYLSEDFALNTKKNHPSVASRHKSKKYIIISVFFLNVRGLNKNTKLDNSPIFDLGK